MESATQVEAANDPAGDAPGGVQAALSEAEALIAAGRPAAALPVLAVARTRFPDDFRLGSLEVDALGRCGKWQAALAAGVSLFKIFRGEATAGMGLADALEALGRAGDAEALLRDAHQRFPADRQVPARLAEMIAARGAAAEAVSWWRKAGLPADGSARQLRDYAHALLRTGQASEAQAMLASADAGLADRRLLALAQAELLLREGNHAEALRLWPALRDTFEPGHADFGAFTWALAMQVPGDAATGLLVALLDEADRPDPDWLPAIGRALAHTEPSGLSHAQDRVRAALAASPAGPDTLARAVAAALAGPELDADALSLRVARAARDGRAELVALLLETEGQPARAARMRIALRLYVNREFADPGRFALLPAEQVVGLLLIARVLDAECFGYFAGLARGRFASATPPDLSLAQDVAGCVAHARLPDERPQASPLPARLRVAVCVHGHPAATPSPVPLAQALQLETHDVTVFAHLWRRTSGTTPPPEAVVPRLPPQLRQAVEAASVTGFATLAALYPELLSGGAVAGSVDEATMKARYATDHVVVEDGQLPQLRSRPESWLRRRKVMLAHRLASQSGLPFDLVIHVAADVDVRVAPTVRWDMIAADSAKLGVVFADGGLGFRRGAALSMGSALVAGRTAEMEVAADSFSLGEYVAGGQAVVAGLPLHEVHRHSQPMFLHLLGIGVAAMPGLVFAAADLDQTPIAPDTALALVRQALRSRPPAPSDGEILRAAIADTTG